MVDPGMNGKGPIGEPVGPFRVLDTATRRRAGVVYLLVAALGGVLVLATDVSVLWVSMVIPIAGLAIFQFAGGWKIRVTDMEAISIASEGATFAVGHASGTLGFRGLLAKPVWQVLVFAAGDAPARQALVTVDGLSGAILGSYEEDVPTP